jgi:hypothetical protein
MISPVAVVLVAIVILAAAYYLHAVRAPTPPPNSGCSPPCGPGEACVGGACVSACPSACAPPDCACAADGSCVPASSGACCPPCGPGETCANGRCAKACAPPCSSGEVCQDGACVPGCGAGVVCPAGTSCVGDTCVPDACSPPCGPGCSCAAGACVPSVQGGCCPACGAGQICKNGACVAACGPSTCSGGRVCYPNNLCGNCSTNDQCEQYYGGAAGFTKCGGDGLCHPNSWCAQTTDCLSGETCVNNTCVTPCSSNAQCGAGRYCVGGQCSDVCTSDGDCAGANEFCRGGRCVPKPSCPSLPPPTIDGKTRYNVVSHGVPTNQAGPWVIGGGGAVAFQAATGGNMVEYGAVVGPRFVDPSAAQDPRKLTDVTLAPGPQAGTFYLAALGGMPLGRNDNTLQYGATYRANGQAYWTYVGGMLVSPDGRLALGAKMCSDPDVQSYYSSHTCSVAPGLAVPYVGPYDPYACDPSSDSYNTEYIWEFVAPSPNPLP